jgi:hypothetical protein
MPHTIDLDGLPEPVAQAIVETILNLKTRYREETEQTARTNVDLPSHPGRAVGSLRRVDIYEDR